MHSLAQCIVIHGTKGINDLFCSMVRVFEVIRFVRDGLAADVQQTKGDMSHTQLPGTKAGTRCSMYTVA